MEDGPIKISRKSDQLDDTTKEKLKFLDNIKRYIRKLNFSVEFDGIKLRKPILLPTSSEITKIGEDFDIYTFEEKFDDIEGAPLKFRGYLYNQKESIYPPQCRGIVIRVKNTAVGDPDHNFLEYLYGEKLFLNWTFGEIYVEEELEEAMNINRNINKRKYDYVFGGIPSSNSPNKGILFFKGCLPPSKNRLST